ncbi:hypothetical protein A4X09_0g7672, partial [Tilletia walkeri]
MQLINARLRNVYNAILDDKPLATTPHSYGFAEVGKYLESRNHEEDRSFWQNYLNGAERLQMLAGAHYTSQAKNRQQIEASYTGTVELHGIAKELNIAPSTIFLYSLAVALQLITDQEDVSFGLLLTGRTLPVSGIENIIGPCINTTLCRVLLKEDKTTRESLQEFQAHLDDINERGYLGLVDIANAAGVDAGAIANALAEYRNLPASVPDSDDKDAFHSADVTGDDRVTAPLFISGGPSASGKLRVNITADAKVLPEPDAMWLAKHVSKVASWIAETGAKQKLSSMSIVDTEEFDLIMECAAAPSQTSSNQKNSTRIGSGSIVPVCMEKCSIQFAYIVAVLKAGAAFVPLDPANPWARKLFITKQVDATIVITSGQAVNDPWLEEGFKVLRADKELLPSNTAPTCPGNATPEDLAYIIFTSGSTGTPKGVMIRHSQVSAYIGAKESMSMEPATSRRLHLSSTAFDASIGDIFGALANGGTSYLANVPKMLTDFSQALDDGMANRVFITPAVAQMLTGKQQPSWLCHLMLGGEGYSPVLRDALLPFFSVENVYGPTETVVTATSYHFAKDQKDTYLPLGRTIGTCRIYVVKPGSTEIQPIGAIGEICIGGPQVGAGYLKDEEKTNAKFVSDPFVEGGRMFRTGDLGRLHGDAKFECVGRIDGQVKIRGLRIETGEIEAAIAADQTVDQAKVLKMQLADEVDRLVGFVVLHGD